VTGSGISPKWMAAVLAREMTKLVKSKAGASDMLGFRDWVIW
jgi:hypothetical protein